ncbi:MAG: hypothetical protein ACI4BD_01530 [Paludibacteraceae bacterium]
MMANYATDINGTLAEMKSIGGFQNTTCAVIESVFNRDVKTYGTRDVILKQRVQDIVQVIHIARMHLRKAALCTKDNETWMQFILVVDAMIWYNSCYDYIGQYCVLYKKLEDLQNNERLYIDNSDYINILSTKKFIEHSSEKHSQPLSDLYGKLQELRTYVNYAKHRLPLLPSSDRGLTVAVGKLKSQDKNDCLSGEDIGDNNSSRKLLPPGAYIDFNSCVSPNDLELKVEIAHDKQYNRSSKDLLSIIKKANDDIIDFINSYMKKYL